MNAANTRLLASAALLATWIALVVFQVPGDEQIVEVIKYTLAMMCGYHAGDRVNAPQSIIPPPTKEQQ